MISLELAKKLKDAGLKWSPKMGDFYHDVDMVWLPKLDQMLKEIMRQGYLFKLSNYNDGTILIDFWKDDYNLVEGLLDDTLEDAVASALISILEQEDEKDE